MKRKLVLALMGAMAFSILLVALPVQAHFFGSWGNRRYRSSTWDNLPPGYEHGIAVDLGDGKDWYFDGPEIEPGVTDIPGHAWKQINKWFLVGLHYNVDPSGELPFWASGEEPGVLLYKVDAIISPWSEESANKMAKQGYIHYHELVSFDAEGNPIKHPNLVVWLKHTGMKDFYFDGGPPAPFNFPHEVFKNRVDLLFIPLYFVPYPEA
jgi:hypothetical protein